MPSEIQRAFRDYVPPAGEDPIAVHIGINTGDAVLEGDDYIGHTVIVASRLADAAAPGEILVVVALRTARRRLRRVCLRRAARDASERDDPTSDVGVAPLVRLSRPSGVGRWPGNRKRPGQLPRPLATASNGDGQPEAAIPTIGALRLQVSCRAEEGGVTVTEDTSIGGDQPVAVAVSGGSHPHDRLVQLQAAGRAVEDGVAIAEDTTIGGDEPVAAAVRRWRPSHDWSVQLQAAGRAVEDGVAIAEDTTVGGHQPVALAVGRGSHAHDRLVESQAPVEPKKVASP